MARGVRLRWNCSGEKGFPGLARYGNGSGEVSGLNLQWKRGTTESTEYIEWKRVGKISPLTLRMTLEIAISPS